MINNAFLPADILVPNGVDMTKWSVVACDQFSSENEYWDRVEKAVGSSPSAFKLIVPEARLDVIDTVGQAVEAGAEMENYLKSGLFRNLDNSVVYLERTLTDGSVRRGLVGMIDLEAYAYRPGSSSFIRASERTILSRLPARMEIRKRALLEMPHIMALIDDENCQVIETLSGQTHTLEPVYDFQLMEGGGTIKGWRVSDQACSALSDRLSSLFSHSSVHMIIGDGNHSLAAAKDYWDEVKSTLEQSALDGHPARYALVELNNVYDPAIRFEAIHRFVSKINPEILLKALETLFAGGSGREYPLGWVTSGSSGQITACADSIGSMIEKLQVFLDEYLQQNGGSIDYIHGDHSLKKLSEADGCLGLMLPPMDKSEFFTTVINGGVFPKKSFSIGHAQDKRYYLECRAIR